jgi:isopentenyldiphosphate isomerase
MERLVIDVPDKKSALVKQILEELGVTIQKKTSENTISDYQQKLAQVSVWSDEDIKAIEDAKKAFNSLKPAEW